MYQYHDRSLQVLTNLDQASWETIQFTKELFHAKEDEASTEGLVAAFFGALGILAAYATWGWQSPSTFAVAAPAGAALGIMFGLLLRMGPRRFALERRLRNREIENMAKARRAELLLGQLGALPEDAPYEVREDIWRAYRTIMQDLAQDVK